MPDEAEILYQWAMATAGPMAIYTAFSEYYRKKEDDRRREDDARFFIAARVVKHMGIAIDVWEETRSQEDAWEAWKVAMEVEFPEENEALWRLFDNAKEEVRSFARCMAARLCLEFFRLTVWDHIKKPSV